MCWTPELVEFPCIWKKEGQENIEELGIEPETESGVVTLDIKSVTRINNTWKKGETNIDLHGNAWTVQLDYKDVIKICEKCGVSFKKAYDVLGSERTE